jgi:Holliday junction resolvase RusA-like endonuclease
LVDALKGLLLVDDDPAHLELVVRQQLGKERGVRITIRPLEG